MNREQFATALKELHTPLQRQQIRTNAVGERYGATSKEYKTECKKEANLILAVRLKEWEIWCSFMGFLLIESIQNGQTKEYTLEFLVDYSKGIQEDEKPALREVYKQIKSLP